MTLKIAEVGPLKGEIRSSLDDISKVLQVEMDWQKHPAPSEDEIKEILQDVQACVVGGQLTLGVHKWIQHRSVGSHFLNHIDFIYKYENKLWGHSLFSDAFVEVFRGNIKKHDYKGSVIFLGENERVAPILSALSRFGFEDFVFLELEEEMRVDTCQHNPSGLIQVQLSKVDSQDFVQSQKEYSLCFVMEDLYSEQTLEDMSYFHFLSNQSMVFDLSGASNFLFEEVEALGVGVVKFDDILAAHCRQYQKILQSYFQKTTQRSSVD